MHRMNRDKYRVGEAQIIQGSASGENGWKEGKIKGRKESLRLAKYFNGSRKKSRQGKRDCAGRK